MTDVREQMTDDRGQRTEIIEWGIRNAECGTVKQRAEALDCGFGIHPIWDSSDLGF